MVRFWNAIRRAVCSLFRKKSKPAGEKKPVLVEGGTCAPKQKPDIMDILEAATGHLTGMQAVCTAGALQHLMYWRHPEDLLRARDHIDYLLDLLQRTEGR